MGEAEGAATLVTEPGLMPELLDSRWGFSTAQAVPKAGHSKCRLWAWWGEVAQEPSTGPGQGLHPPPPRTPPWGWVRDALRVNPPPHLPAGLPGQGTLRSVIITNSY